MSVSAWFLSPNDPRISHSMARAAWPQQGSSRKSPRVLLERDRQLGGWTRQESQNPALRRPRLRSYRLGNTPSSVRNENDDLRSMPGFSQGGPEWIGGRASANCPARLGSLIPAVRQTCSPAHQGEQFQYCRLTYPESQKPSRVNGVGGRRGAICITICIPPAPHYRPAQR